MKSNVLGVVGILLTTFLSGCSDRYTSYQTDDSGSLMINKYKIVVKDIPAFDFIASSGKVVPEQLQQESKDAARRVFIAANRQDVELMGPLTILLGEIRYLAGGPLDASIGFPARGDFRPQNNVTWQSLGSFDCLTVSLPVDVLDIETYWAALIRATYRFGFKPSGQFRSVLKFNDTNTGYLLELQVGV